MSCKLSLERNGLCGKLIQSFIQNFSLEGEQCDYKTYG